MIIPRIEFYNLLLLLFVLSFSFMVSKSAYSQYVCLPTCSEIDAHFFQMAGIDASTINNQDTVLGIISPAAETMLEIGIFDGDSIPTGHWDIAIPTQFEATLRADPLQDGVGTILLATYSSDGSFGDNIGDPMPDNDWFTITLPQSPDALNGNGDFSYVITIRNLTPNAEGFNSFKVRVLDTSSFFIFPLTAFNVQSSVGGLLDLAITYPNLDFDDPACFDPMTFTTCDAGDPTCCLHETNYDGIYTFFFEVPEGLTRMEMWDGDFDYGSSMPDPAVLAGCIADGVDVDSDDPNTPGDPFLPPWAVGTTAVFEGISSPTNPPDDGCDAGSNGVGFSTRSPSVFYRLIDPNGVIIENLNPSGTEEWEMFSITSVGPLDPSVDDLLVDDIPAGVWRLEIVGLDLQNLNSLVWPFGLSSVPPRQGGEFVLNPIFPALDDNINSLSAENATPNSNVAFTWGKIPGSFILGGNVCNGTELGIDRPRLLTIERANQFGVSTHIFYIPLFSDFEFTIQLQAVDIETCRVSNQIEQIIRKDESG